MCCLLYSLPNGAKSPTPCVCRVAPSLFFGATVLSSVLLAVVSCFRIHIFPGVGFVVFRRHVTHHTLNSGYFILRTRTLKPEALSDLTGACLHWLIFNLCAVMTIIYVNSELFLYFPNPLVGLESSFMNSWCQNEKEGSPRLHSQTLAFSFL